MSWFIYALICTAGWGCADLFYKKGTDETDKLSHWKIAVWVGLVMGVCSFALLPVAESGIGIVSPRQIFTYAPASISYILSMVVGYAGLRYLEISVVSPVQNASGALSAVVIVLWFLFTGRHDRIGELLSGLDLIGTVFVVLGVVALAVAEHRLSRAEHLAADKKYRLGARALLFPLIYCLLDTVGTAADGILLDEHSGANLGEIDVLVLYGITFFLFGIGAWLYMLLRYKVVYNPFARSERAKGIAALCEEFGQVFYVYAMASRPVLAAPMVASYCVFSVILSRIFLKEKLELSRYICVAVVVAGIILLGISEGLAEL